MGRKMLMLLLMAVLAFSTLTEASSLQRRKGLREVVPGYFFPLEREGRWFRDASGKCVFFIEKDCPDETLDRILGLVNGGRGGRFDGADDGGLQCVADCWKQDVAGVTILFLDVTDDEHESRTEDFARLVHRRLFK